MLVRLSVKGSSTSSVVSPADDGGLVAASIDVVEGIPSPAEVVGAAAVVVVAAGPVVVSDALPPVHADKATAMTRAGMQRSTSITVLRIHPDVNSRSARSPTPARNRWARRLTGTAYCLATFVRRSR
jgi:hypothetical protein